MRRRVALLVAAPLALAAATGLAIWHVDGREQVARTTRPVVPGDFETDPAAVGWRLTDGSGSIGLDRTRSRTGTSSLRVLGGAGTSTSARYTRVAARPGQTFQLGAYSLVTSGRQQLRMTFLDDHGRPLTTTTSPTGPPQRLWSRVSLAATAPPRASTAAVSIESVAGAASATRWDDLALVDLTVPDGGFEDGVGDSGCPVAWTCATPPGTTVERSSGSQRSGAAGVVLRDASHDAAARARSPLVQVIPSVGHVVSAWVRRDADSPDPTLTLRWYDGSGMPLPLEQTPVRAAGGSGWERLETTATAPDAAAWVSVELATSDAGTGTVSWDDVTVAPAGPAPAVRWTTTAVGRLDGFATTTTSLVADVRGRPQLVTVVSGAPATVQVVDIQSGQVEDSRPLPGLVHGWAMTLGVDGKSVYLGSGSGHLARYDLQSRTLTDLGRATPRATLVFDLATAPDGRVWGASYPGGEVWVHDPRRMSFETVAPVGTDHEYARSIAVDGSWVYVGTGAVDPGILRISATNPAVRSTITLPEPASTGFVRGLDLEGSSLFAVLPSGRRSVYDTVTRTWDPRPVVARSQPVSRAPGPAGVPTVGGSAGYVVSAGRLWRMPMDETGRAGSPTPVAGLPSGFARDRSLVRTTFGGVGGDWLVSFDAAGTVTAIDVTRLPVASPGVMPPAAARTFPVRLRVNPVPIKSLAIGSHGEVLVGGFGGSSLSMLDPSDPEPRLRPLISDPAGRDAFGEVEGMVSNGPYDFFGSYGSARLFRRDAARPWVDGENPRLLANLGTRLGQDRPIAWAASGQRTVFGTIPQYGRRGGVLGWFDGADPTPRTVWSPIPEQSVVALAGAGARPVVYGGTSRWGGLGVAPARQTAEVFAYDLDSRRTLWHVAPLRDAQAFAAVLLDDAGRLWAATRTTLVQLDPRNGAVVRRVPLTSLVEPDSPTYRTVDLAQAAGAVVVATSGGLFAIDPNTLSVQTVTASGVQPARVRASGGTLYYPARSVLVRATPR